MRIAPPNPVTPLKGGTANSFPRNDNPGKACSRGENSYNKPVCNYSLLFVMKKILFVMLLSVGLVTGCGPATQGPITTSDEIMKIGFISALTGDAASLGQADKTTVEMFFEENPMIAGKKVQVIYEDGQCNGQKGASAAEKLVNVDKVQVILGAGCSGETLAAAPIVERAKVLLFSSTSTSPEVTKAGDYVFRNAPSDDKSAVVLTDILSKKFKKAALITQNNDYSQAYRKQLQDQLPKAGVELVIDEAFNTGTTDFKSLLQKVKNSEAEVLINLPGETSPAGFISKQARELGIDLPVYSGDVISGTEFFDIAKDAAEGAIIVIATADTTRPDVSAFSEKLKTRLGDEVAFEAYMMLSWDRLNILKKAIETVGYDATAIKDYLYAMDTYKGLGGDTKFDANGDASILPNVMIARDGKFEIYKE